MEIYLDGSCIGKVISELPFVKLLSIPNWNKENKRWECLAQVNECLAIIEVNLHSLK